MGQGENRDEMGARVSGKKRGRGEMVHPSSIGTKMKDVAGGEDTDSRFDGLMSTVYSWWRYNGCPKFFQNEVIARFVRRMVRHLMLEEHSQSV